MDHGRGRDPTKHIIFYMRTYNGYNQNKEYKQKFEVPIHNPST